MSRYGLVGFMKMELPTGDVRLCDGGFLKWGSETFLSADPVFGSIASFEAPTEGIEDQVPDLVVGLQPPGTSAAGDLSHPSFQTARVRFWIAEYDVDLGTLIGTPQLEFSGQFDRAKVTWQGAKGWGVEISVVSLTERLFELDIGNGLSSRWHQSIWPGELGHDNGTGLAEDVAWGVLKPQSGSSPVTPSPAPYVRGGTRKTG